MFRSASDLYSQVVEATQNMELWERSRTKPGENQIKNEIRCSPPFRICIKRVLEAKQNQENPCRLLLHKRKNEIRCSAPPRICIKRVVETKQNQELWERSPTKPGESN